MTESSVKHREVPFSGDSRTFTGPATVAPVRLIVTNPHVIRATRRLDVLQHVLRLSFCKATNKADHCFDTYVEECRVAGREPISVEEHAQFLPIHDACVKWINAHLQRSQHSILRLHDLKETGLELRHVISATGAGDVDHVCSPRPSAPDSMRKIMARDNLGLCVEFLLDNEILDKRPNMPCFVAG